MGRTIDEAIANARKVADRKKKAFQNCEDDCRFCLASKPCNESAEEQEQLAEWLEELQSYKQGNCTNDCEHFDNGVKYGYEKGVDDFIHSYYEYCEKQYGRLADDELVDMQKVSEKLKDGGKYGR